VVDVREAPAGFPTQGSIRLVVNGEAVFVDMGPGQRPLIALLTAKSPRPGDRPASARKGWAYETPGLVIDRAYRGEKEFHNGRLVGGAQQMVGRGPREITPEDLPDLVTFADPTDPMSVMAVDPEYPSSALLQKVKWRRITIEVTDEAVTSGIEAKLKWLKGFKGSLAHSGERSGVRRSNALPETLSRWNFKRGDN
jgi:hypothetical protein